MSLFTVPYHRWEWAVGRTNPPVSASDNLPATPQQAARPQWSHHANWALFGGILNKAHFNWWFAYRSCFFLLLCCLPLCKMVVLLCAFCICVLCLSRFSLCRSRMRAQKLYQLDGVWFVRFAKQQQVKGNVLGEENRHDMSFFLGQIFSDRVLKHHFC